MILLAVWAARVPQSGAAISGSTVRFGTQSGSICCEYTSQCSLDQYRPVTISQRDFAFKLATLTFAGLSLQCVAKVAFGWLAASIPYIALYLSLAFPQMAQHNKSQLKWMIKCMFCVCGKAYSWLWATPFNYFLEFTTPLPFSDERVY